ncbi:MAG: Grx4 family monothiol glutaredoxin [Myxococcota bacterium]|nr:Grx4 family monothiol glutaredoxin [Myxococcota bacterium]
MPLTDRQRADFDKLVHSNQVVLFMKGNRRFPQCGFSATVVGILDKITSGYETVNILADPSVRDGMKEFSSWPTFPQLYVKGEFVGGCDIVKAMYESGELQKLFGVDPNREKNAKAPAVTISTAAARAFAEAAPGGGTDVLRLEIDSQFNCDLHFGPKAPGDIEVTSSGVVVHVAAASADRANGIAIDFVSGPKGMGFKIDNPNEPPRVKPIGPKELRALLEQGKIELFDVRPDPERALASIDRARKLDAEGQRYLVALHKDAAIALHCHHGSRSRAAAEQLLQDGFTNVYNLEGGIDAWSNEVDTSVPRY